MRVLLPAPLAALLLAASGAAADYVAAAEPPGTGPALLFGPGDPAGLRPDPARPFAPAGTRAAPVLYQSPPVIVDGLFAALSWTPQAGLDLAGEPLPFLGTEESRAGALGWRTEILGLGLQLGGGFLSREDGADLWQARALLSFQSLAFGVHLDDGDGRAQALGIGARWDAGPWTFTGSWTTALDGPGLTNVGLAASYSVAPGITGTLSWAGSETGTGTERSYDTTFLGYLRIGF